MKKSVIYFLCTFILIALSILNISGKNYTNIDKPELIDEEYTDENGNVHKSSSTERLSLTKGKYRFVICYSSPAPAAIEACAGHDTLSEGVLEACPENGFYEMELELSKPTSDFFFRITDPGDLEIYNYEVAKNGHIIYDDIFYAFLVLIFALIIYYFLYRYWKGQYVTAKLVFLMLLAAVTVFVSSPVFNDYLLYGFDLDFHLSRIEGMKDAFLDGQLIPVIYPGNNNGYGVLGFMYPFLFLIPSALLRLCNVSMVASYHFFILLENALTVIIAWKASRSFTSAYRISFLSALLCALNPLRLTSLYQCASIGEALGMTFMPLFFAGMYEVIYGNKKKWYYITIAYSAMLMSHILSCVIVAIATLVILLFSVREIFEKNEKRYKELGLSILLFLLINSWYIVLFVRFFCYRLNSDYIFCAHYYKDTIIPAKLFMMSTSNSTAPQADEGILDGCIQGPGISGLLCLLAVLLDVLIPDKEKRKEKKWFGICLALTCVAIYLGTSAFPWYKTTENGIINRFMGTIQFPYRFYEELFPVIFILAPVSIEHIEKRLNYDLKLFLTVTGVFSIIAAYTVMDTFNVQEPFKTPYSGGYTLNPLMEYLPKDTDTEVFKNTSPHNFGSETISYKQNGTKAELECRTYDEGAYVILPMLYYPFYSATSESGEKYRIGRSPDGRIQIFMPVRDEVQKIKVRYTLSIR